MIRALVGLAVLAIATAGAASPLTANGTQPGLVHPLPDSTACAACHGDYVASADFEPLPTWRGTMMAQSARDPLFWAALDVANADLPGAGDFCLRCHAPAAWLAGRVQPPGGSLDGCALAGTLDLPGGDFDGVTCAHCHRMQINPSPPAGEQKFYLENSQWWIDDGDCGGAGEPCRHGPYNYTFTGTPPPHAWKHSPYVRGAEHCGACHNVTNPVKTLIDAGIDTGIPFPIERTYDEWGFSDFGFLDYDGTNPGLLKAPLFTTCQQCHMPESGVSPAWASSFLLNDHTGDLGVHVLAGGNAWIPDVLRQEYPSLGIGASLTAARDRALHALQQQSATVEVIAAASAPAGVELPVSVKVTNLTGHKLPTGYPEGRRMWLHVQARDGTGAVFWESGRYDPTTGVLTRDAQAKVYEARQGEWDAATGTCVVADGGRELFHFVLNDCIALDNRIPPLGFRPDAETRPVGHVYPEVAPGKLVNHDVTTYTVPIADGTPSPVTVTATLRYQTTSREYVEFLRDQAVTRAFPDDCLPRTTGLLGTTRGEFLHELWEAYDRSPPVDMTSGAVTTAVTPVDAFTCYKAKPMPGSDGFTPVAGMPANTALDATALDVKSPRYLCGAANTGGGTADPSARLLAYKARQSATSTPHAPRTLTVTDALGTLLLDSVKIEMLGRPAASSPGPPPPPPPAASGLDDYICYKVRATPGAPRFPGALVSASDGLDGALRGLRLTKPRTLCLPADTGGGTSHPSAALLCYVAKVAPDGPRHTPLIGLQVSDAFGSLSMRTVQEKLVCLPAVTTP